MATALGGGSGGGARTVQLAPNRPLDAYYDGTYTVANQRDLYRSIQRENPPNSKPVIVPGNMFADSRVHPSLSLKFQTRGPPAAVASDTNVTTVAPVRFSNHQRQAIVASNHTLLLGPERWRYFKRPLVPVMRSLAPGTVLDNPTASADAMGDGLGMNGMNQQQFNSMPGVYGGSAGASVSFASGIPGGKVDAATQSDYRESETQTDPYTPDYIVPEGTDPEILALISLTWGNGLPVGAEEIQMIERARRRKAVESNLPSFSDAGGFEKRMRMMQELELLEWKEREEHIKALQDQRLDLLTRALTNREAEREQATEARLAANRERRFGEFEDTLEFTRQERIKFLRKLAKRRQNELAEVNRLCGPEGTHHHHRTRLRLHGPIDGRQRSRDVIAEYAYHGSAVYAPVTRHGRHPDRHAHLFDARPGLLENYHGLLFLEKSLPRSLMIGSAPDSLTVSRPKLATELLMSASVSASKSGSALSASSAAVGVDRTPHHLQVIPSSNAKRKERQLREMLELADSKLKSMAAMSAVRSGSESGSGPDGTALPGVDGLNLSGTGKIGSPGHHKSNQREAMNKLAELYTTTPRVVRPPTPSIEYTADDGEELAALFIQRLLRGRSVQNVYFEGKEKMLRYVRELRAIDHIRLHEEVHLEETTRDMLDSYRTRWIHNVVHQVEGDTVGQMLDYLSKELVRHREEQRIAAMIAMAERQRRMREAEESGRRQEEEELRAREDEKFRQVMNVQHGTVDSYLDSIISNAVEHSSARRAVEEAHEKAKTVGDALDMIEKREENPSDVVRGLLASFIFPEVHRRNIQDKVHSDQKTFLLAAHKAIYDQLLPTKRPTPASSS